MRKGLLLAGILLCGVGASVASAAFPADEIQVLASKDIGALSDEKLMENYMDVVVELEAVKTFHTTSGFLPKEYQRYKEILKYRLQLLYEMNKRKLEIPPSIN